MAGADLGPTCPTVEGTPSKQMMTCGGKDCQGAAKLWETVGMKMHQGMAIRFTGSPDIDFVRGMIPHHQGAVDMCDILRGPLWCSVKGNLTDGLEHFCNHVKQEQERELAGMNAWLDKRGNALCLCPRFDGLPWQCRLDKKHVPVSQDQVTNACLTGMPCSWQWCTRHPQVLLRRPRHAT